jgi:hypothetical protein
VRGVARGVAPPAAAGGPSAGGGRVGAAAPPLALPLATPPCCWLSNWSSALWASCQSGGRPSATGDPSAPAPLGWSFPGSMLRPWTAFSSIASQRGPVGRVAATTRACQTSRAFCLSASARLGEVFVGLAQDQRRVARLADVLQRGHEQGIGFASPRGAPEEGLAVGQHQELGLLGGRLVEDVGVLDDGLRVDPESR